jgi:hypothetical protein
MRTIVAVAVLVLSINLHAAQRTFVSAGLGNDVNVCSRLQPCRNFARAITQTDSAGEVIVLDSGGYGAVTIDKPVSIISPAGVYAGITAFSGDAITMDPALTTGTVKLRGLTLNGLGGDDGIVDIAANAPFRPLYLDDISVNGFTTGMRLFGYSKYYISNCQVRESIDNGVWITGVFFQSHARLTGVVVEGSGGNGILIDNALVDIDRSSATSNFSYGFYARGSDSSTAVVSIDNSHAALNQGGFVAGGTNGTPTLYVSNSLATMNGYEGVYASTGATVRVTHTSSVHNGKGLVQAGTGVLESRGDNNVRGNTGGQTDGTITVYTPE